MTQVANDGCGATNAYFYWLDETGRWDVTTTGIVNTKGGFGYWFYSTKGCQVTIEGTGDVTATDIELPSGGWVQIGAPKEGLADLSSIPNYDASCNFLWWNPTAKSWEEKTILEGGKGYRAIC